MLSVCATREQRTQWSGQNTCCSETMKRPKVSQGTDGEGTRCCFKDLDAVLWVMGKLWRLIRSDIVLQLVSPLGRTFSHSLFFYPPLGILTIPVMLLSLSKQKYQPHMAWPTFPTLSGHRLLLIVLHYGTSESASRFSSLSLPAQIIDKRRRNRSPIWTSPKF